MLSVVFLLYVGCIAPALAAAQETPSTRFQVALALLKQKRLPEARAAFLSLLSEYDTPENRADVEFDSLLAGSYYSLGETYFQEDQFEEAASRYTEVIASFRTFRPESYYHLGLSKHYRRDYLGAIGILGELVAEYPGSAQAPQALYYQGICYELLKDKAAANATFKTMIERYPQHPWTKKARERALE